MIIPIESVLVTITVLSIVANLMCAKIIMDEGFLSHPFWTRSIRSLLLIPPFAIIFLVGGGIIELTKEIFSWVRNIISQYLRKRTDI